MAGARGHRSRPGELDHLHEDHEDGTSEITAKEITAKTTVDGVVVEEARRRGGKSSGQYAVVTVNQKIGSLG